jgi:acylphosphatase
MPVPDRAHLLNYRAQRKDSMANIRVHLFISGRVQGVFFRAHTREEAKRRGLTGWVKNRYDSRVEAVFEGEDEAVQSMIGWCHSGPPHAVVTDVSVEAENYRGEYADFTVRG